MRKQWQGRGSAGKEQVVRMDHDNMNEQCKHPQREAECHP